MVRKRSRRYQSDDNDSDSDVDFDTEQRSQPAPKKYSLRERKNVPLFTTDFDYYGLDEEDGEGGRQSSDEDFEVEADVDGARTYFEPDTDVDPSNAEGLIDFEDIIRADIVVNKNKIDYDNLIEKSEIKFTQPKKRGRKPKKQVEGSQEQEPDSESNLDSQPPLKNDDAGDKNEENGANCNADKKEENEKEVSTEIKETVPPEINFCDGQDGLPNGDLSENGEKVESEADPLVIKNASSIETVMLKPPPVAQEGEKVEEEDDDVIVLGELKQDVIVLDD